MEFRKFADRLRRYSDPGSPEEIVYSPVFDDRGSWHLEPTGKRDVQTEIDSFEESCNLHNLIARYENGDLDVLQQRVGNYFDTTEYPTTFAEFLQYRIDAEKQWSDLPTEVKRKFDNNVDQFIATAGSEVWFDNLGFEKKTEQFSQKEEVIENA